MAISPIPYIHPHFFLTNTSSLILMLTYKLKHNKIPKSLKNKKHIIKNLKKEEVISILLQNECSHNNVF